MKKHIRVAAAVIVRDGHFLLSKRKLEQHQGGKWEFPGGKIEANETLEQALSREIREEINIEVKRQSSFYQLDFEYPEKNVSLYFQLVDEFDGQEQGLEGQLIGWFTKAELLELTFPDANIPVLEKIEQLF
jgi:8-oxo-dGTP diphosphatase